MFFRRQKGEYRETDRVTRFKLIKSGKHWLRASTSLFGLFKVMRGSADTNQVKTEMVEKQEGQKLTGLDVLKGIAATGTILGGFAATQTRVYANDAVAVEKTVESKDTWGRHRIIKILRVCLCLLVKASHCQNSIRRAPVNLPLRVSQSMPQALLV